MKEKENKISSRNILSIAYLGFLLACVLICPKNV